MSTVLSELIDERAWDGVLARLQSHPQEAAVKIARGYGESLPLHEACKLQPSAKVVKALVAAHESAISTKGQWSFLPLHFAVRSNSLYAVAPLLEAYPRGARLKEDGGKLPIHLGCQWGSSSEVIERLLTLYPEGIYVRDDDGKSPMDYAEALKVHSKEDYDKVLASMQRGLVYCAVSKAAFFRVKEEFDELMRGTVEAHNTHVTKLEKGHLEEITVHRQLEEGLRSSLKQSGETLNMLQSNNQILSKEKDDLNLQLNILRNAEQVLQSQTDRLEKKVEEKENEFKAQSEALVLAETRLEGLLLNLETVQKRNMENDKEIEALTEVLLSLSASVDALTIPQAFAERAMNHQHTALCMVLGDNNTLIEQTLHHQEKMLNESIVLEGIVLSAETTNTERVVCDPFTSFDQDFDPTDKEGKPNKLNGGSDKSTVVTSAGSFSSIESMGGDANQEEKEDRDVDDEYVAGAVVGNVDKEL